MRRALIFGLAFVMIMTSLSCSGGGGGSENHSDDSDDISGSGAESCGSRSDFFSVAPLNSEDYTGIDPLGNVAPPAHTFPTVHTYMMLTDNRNPAPVYSPGDITISRVSSVTNLAAGHTDYALNFSLCPDVWGYFDHVSTLADSVMAQTGEFSDCRNYSDGMYEYQVCDKDVSIPLTAGELIGYAGSSDAPAEGLSSALDFGMRDYRTEPIEYANPDRLVASDQLYVVCPYDYYEAGAARDELFEKLRTVRTVDPVCGTVALDLVNTAQGRWYLKNSEKGNSEENHIALVPSNQTPDTVNVLSIGNSSVGTDDYYFDFLSNGQINSKFSAAGFDGKIFCYENLRNREGSLESGNSQSIQGYIFFQLTSSTSMKIERVSQNISCPDPASLSFTGAAVEFER